MTMCHVLSCFSHVQLFEIPWTVARESPPSMGFSGKNTAVGLPCPPAGDLRDPGIERGSPMSNSIPGFRVLHYLLEFAQIHVH